MTLIKLKYLYFSTFKKYLNLSNTILNTLGCASVNGILAFLFTRLVKSKKCSATSQLTTFFRNKGIMGSH